MQLTMNIDILQINDLHKSIAYKRPGHDHLGFIKTYKNKNAEL